MSRHLLTSFAGLWLLLGIMTSAAWAQSSSIDQQFAAYHGAMSATADTLLGVRSQPVMPQQQRIQDVTPDKAAAGNRAFSAALARVQRLRPALEPILRQEGLPAPLSAVVLVESGGQRDAMSAKGARGLWQLMPETARRYGLTVSPPRDDRLDPVLSTRAAARYLRDLYGQFGDWSLAFAAYNAGEQAVQRAIERAGANDFVSLKPLLPAETRAYVPAVLASLPLLGASPHLTPAALSTAREAQVLYAIAQLKN